MCSTQNVVLLLSATANDIVLEPNTKSKSNILQYNSVNIYQLPELTISHYGIPSDNEYYKTDDKRAFIKTPLLVGDELEEKLKEFDDYFSSEDFRKYYKIKKKFQYCPILKVVDSESNKPNYFKLKLKYYDNNVKSELVDTENNKLETNGLDELKNNVCYKSSFKSLIRLKMWMQPDSLKNPMYGFTLEVQKIKITQKPIKNNTELYFID